MAVGYRWRHEDRLGMENKAAPFSLIPMEDGPVRLQAQRDRDASRPLPQFLYQVNKAFRYSTADDGSKKGSDAYADVRSRWEKAGIWNPAWGTLPGEKWKHEEPLEDVLRYRMVEKYGEAAWEQYKIRKAEREKKREEERIKFAIEKPNWLYGN